MNDEQYNTILKMFTTLSEQIQTLRQGMNAEFAKFRQEMTEEFAKVREEMANEFANMRKEMAAGLAKQEAISTEILNAMNDPFSQLSSDVRKTNQAHSRRLLKIERHIGLA